MKYYWGSKGDMPAGGYPLFLYLHGSGAPDREWSNGLYFARTFADSPSVYFVPKIPRTGEWYRWWQKSKQYAWEKLLRQALASGEIDPDRVYFSASAKAATAASDSHLSMPTTLPPQVQWRVENRLPTHLPKTAAT